MTLAELAALRAAAAAVVHEQFVHAFAWKPGKRGGKYWLPPGAQDIPENRMYGAKAQAAAQAATRQAKVRQQKQKGGEMPKGVQRGLTTAGTAAGGAAIGRTVGGPIGGLIGGALGALFGWDQTEPEAKPAKGKAPLLSAADQKELARRKAMMAKKRGK